MANRSTHLSSETEYSLPPYSFHQVQPATVPQAFWFPAVQAHVGNGAPKYPVHNYPQCEGVNFTSYYQQPGQPYTFNIPSLFTDGVTAVTPPPHMSSYWTPHMMQEHFYIPLRDPPMMGNAESSRNVHLPPNSDSHYFSGYTMGPPPVAQQPPDQLKCQVDRVNGFFRIGNLSEISKHEFLDNARKLFVDGKQWCNFDPTKFHHDYKQPLRELADWLSMYFPGKFSKGEFEDILSLEDLGFVG